MADNITTNDTSQSDKPKITDFDKFLVWACQQYCIVIKVFVSRTNHPKFLSTGALDEKQPYKLRQSKVLRSIIQSEPTSNKDITESSSDASVGDENAVKVETLYDNHENLVELKFLDNKTIPQKVMKVVALTIPYQKYLTSITINSGLNVETIHEISTFLPGSNITELCLDNTFVSKANFHTLLSQSKLKHLSLARCSINDAIVETITDHLVFPHPAAEVLSALNLSSNRITDVGAKYVAGMLRTNRQLCYLNLAGNMLTDEGSMSILETLQKFPLKAKEVWQSKARYMAFLKKKAEFVNTVIKELQAAKEEKVTKKSSSKKRKVDSQPNIEPKHDAETEIEARRTQEKAESVAESCMGLFSDHFSVNNTESQDGVVHCFGNNTLCCLNLAYNNLTYASVKKLRDVLLTQRSLNRTPRGLIRVVIQGNLIPVACQEYDEINRLLGARLGGVRKRFDTLTKKKATGASIKSNKSSFM